MGVTGCRPRECARRGSTSGIARSRDTPCRRTRCDSCSRSLPTARRGRSRSRAGRDCGVAGERHRPGDPPGSCRSSVRGANQYHESRRFSALLLQVGVHRSPSARLPATPVRLSIRSHTGSRSLSSSRNLLTFEDRRCALQHADGVSHHRRTPGVPPRDPVSRTPFYGAALTRTLSGNSPHMPSANSG